MSRIKYNTIIFVFADIINKAIPFLLLPILTRYLGASDYGVLSIYNSIFSFVQILIGFSIIGYLNLNYYKSSHLQKRTIISTAVFIFLGVTIVSLVFGAFLFPLLLKEVDGFWSVLICLTGLFYNINNLVLSIWILEKESIKFSVYQIIETLLKVSISLFLIIFVEMNWQGRVIGVLSGTLIMCFYGVYVLNNKDYVELRYDKKVFTDIYKFGRSLLLHQFSNWVKQNVDKIMIIIFLGKMSSGIYAVAIQFGIVLGILTSAFNKSWVPFFYKNIEIKPKLIRKIIYIYIPVVLSVVFIFNEVFKYLLLRFFQPEFHSAEKYIVFILLGYAFQGMYFMVVNYMFYYNKNKYMSLISFITTLTQLLLVYFVINYYGLKGVSIVFSVSYFFVFMITTGYVYSIINSRKVLKDV